jgi:hypothetical protein
VTLAQLLRVDMEPYLHTIVEPTVADVHRRYGDDVDLDDLRQEAAVWWYGPGQQYVQQYVTEDDKHVRLRRSIWRWCARYAQAQRAEHRGYSPADQQRYLPAQIVQLLPVALDPDGIPDGGGFREGPKAKGNLAEGGDVLASLIDVRRGIAALDFDDQTFLVLAEDLACDWERVAANTSTLPDSCRRRHARIAERIARWLNNETEGY